MKETLQKIWKLIESSEQGVLITQSQEGFAHARVMERVRTPAGEDIWFATSANERKLVEIGLEPRVTVFYFHDNKSWACVYGIAEKIADQSSKSRFWKKGWEKYWPAGPLSADYVLIRISPLSADYLLASQSERGRVSFKNGQA